MKAKDHFTHKGWFFMCPIYLNADDGDGMDVAARFECLEWWFSVQEVFFKIMVFFIETFNEDYEPMFPFKVTGKIK